MIARNKLCYDNISNEYPQGSEIDQCLMLSTVWPNAKYSIDFHAFKRNWGLYLLEDLRLTKFRSIGICFDGDSPATLPQALMQRNVIVIGVVYFMELTLKFEKTEIRPKSHKILMFFSNKTPNMSAVNVMGVFGIIIF